MSKAKINSVSYDELRINVQSAVDMLTEVDTLWGDRFEDLYYAFITSGYLEDLYEDAKSNYYTLKKTVSAIGNVATGALLGCYFGPIGGIIGAVIGLIFGIVEFCKTDPVWITASKEAFEQLLTDCVYGNNDCYIGITNIGTKLMNVQVSLEEIRTKVNEFNYMYASLEESMNELGLNGTMTDDGVLLSVDTEITIDGQTKTTSVSEALNAFYTYQNTVMASRIEAQILADQGFEIDYDALVKNANGFMVNTLDSGLYSREFVLAVMPNYSPDVTGATDAAAAGLGISTSDFQSALSQASSMLGIGAGLVGAGFIGSIGSQMGGDTVCPKCGLPVGQCTCPQDTGTGTQPTDPPKPDDTDKKDDTQKPDDTGKKDDTGSTGTPTVKDETTSGPDKTVPGGTTGTTGTTGGTSGGGGTTIINNYYYGTEDPNKKPDESKPGDEVDEEKEEFSNEVEIPEISKSKIPEKLEDEVVKDYDDIARREYESNKEEIAERRAEIRDDVDHAYSTGNYSSIKSQLKEYGYSEPEINALLNDRDKLTTALITGDQKEAMAARAMELAKEDGVKDFESSYSEPAEYSDLADGTANSLVANMSDNKEVSKAFDNMTDAQTAYKESVEEATVAVEAVAAAKTTMTDLETKFTEKFGTADTSKWDEESAKEYKDAVKDYNKKVEEAEEKLEAKDEAKEEYEEAKEEYIEAKEEFEAEIKENYRESEAHSDAAERAPGSGVVPDDRYTGNGQYPNNGYPNNGYPNNGYPQNGTTGGVVGGTIEGANTVEGGGGIVGLTPPDTVLYGTNTVTNPDGTVAPMPAAASSNDAAMQTATGETAMFTSSSTPAVDTANTHDQATTVEITRDANGNPIANVTISDEDFLRSVLMDEERDKANNNNN